MKEIYLTLTNKHILEPEFMYIKEDISVDDSDLPTLINVEGHEVTGFEVDDVMVCMYTNVVHEAEQKAIHDGEDEYEMEFQVDVYFKFTDHPVDHLVFWLDWFDISEMDDPYAWLSRKIYRKVNSYAKKNYDI